MARNQPDAAMKPTLHNKFQARHLLAALATALPVALLSLAAPADAAVVISQIYGGGGNNSATYTNDFVELCNNGASDVNLAGWTLQYASATGTNWNSSTALLGSIPAGGFLYVKLASGGAVGAALPGTPGVINTGVNISGTAGKLALVSNTTALTAACPSPLPSSVQDLVGYGTTANCFEGATRAPAPSNTTAIIRNASCSDSNVNSSDFTVTSTTFAPRSSASPPPPPPPPPAPTAALICTIQGSGATSPLVSQPVVTSGVVTKVNSDGFFMQHQDCDGLPASSDGIFVFTGSTLYAAAQPGSSVQVTGTVAEYNPGTAGNPDTSSRPLTQISSISAVTATSSMPAVTPVDITLPLAIGDSFERFEGMLVRITSTMTVQQNFFQARFGQLTLGAGGRHETPTNKHPAGSADAIAMAALQARSRLLLDDGSSTQNPNPTPYSPLVNANGQPRGGDTLPSITGVIDFGLATSSTAGAGLYRIHPTLAPTLVASHPRPLAPAAVGGNLRLGAMNVLNYFTTFTDGKSDGDNTSGQGCRIGGVSGTVSAATCRGASNQTEFDRQRNKIVRALAGLDADAIGLMEIQNNGNVAAQNLVSALNAHVGAGTYAVVSDPAGIDAMGTDAIKVAMIYKPARLSPVSPAVSDTAAINNRAPLAQTFAALNGERFTLVVNHLKSKSCSGATGADADQGDGQGCWNATRVLQATQLRTFVGQLQTNSGSNDVLLVGDFNSNGQEDPIRNLTGSGYVDQMGRFSPNSPAYSYVFDGSVGRLDHGISSATMSAKFTGAAYWHINADESLAQDYNLEFKQPACGTCAPDPYSVSPYRSSDHDPVLVGLDLYKAIVAALGSTSVVGSAGDDILYSGAGRRSLTGGTGRDWFVFTAGFAGGATITDFEPGVDAISLRALMQSLGISSADPIVQGHVSCVASGLDALIRVDPDAGGPAAPRAMLLIKGQGCSVLNPGNFAF